MRMKKLIFFTLSFTIIFSCNEKHQLTVVPGKINAEVNGNILTGSSVLNDPDRFVWGASVIKGDDNKYHMLYSSWECGDTVPHFSDSWVLNSKIAYAVSDYPDRDFKFQKIILHGRALDGNPDAWDAQMVHNPHIKKFNDKYYLYFIGSKDPGIQPAGSKGEKLSKRDRVQQNQCIGVIEFENFTDLMNGNFTRPETPLLKPRTRVKKDNIVNPSPEGTETKPDNIIVVNPSVVYNPVTGKYHLYFKGNFYDPSWRGIHGVAISDSPTGPFSATENFVFDIRNEDGTIASGEDPFVWYHKKHKKFYVVLKDFTGKITAGKPGLAILESVDGLEWTKPANPFFMKKEVVLISGDTVSANRLERPQLLLDENDNPFVLFCACSIIDINPTKKGESFNVHIPLQLK